MLPVTARSAAIASGAIPVANRRGRVQHLTPHAHGCLTPTGRLRAGRAPVCGQHARRWSASTQHDARPLCRRCLAWLLRRDPTAPALPYLDAAAPVIERRLYEVTDPAELHLLVMAIVSRRDLMHATVVDPIDGHRRLLRALVSQARARCQHTTMPSPLSIRSSR